MKRVTSGFKLTKMQVDLPFEKRWERESVLSHEELIQILSQKFSYLDRGAQCFVFASEDGAYVLKFFRFDRSNPKKPKKVSSYQKIERMFDATLLAYEKAKEETALLHVHLNPTEDLPFLSVKGPIGQNLYLDLNQYRFVLQRKAVPFRETLVSLIERKDEEALRSHISSFLEMLRSRSKKGLRNTDPSLSRNFGFLDGKAIEIDFGNYTVNGTSEEWEVSRYSHKLRNFLLDLAPESVSYLDEMRS